MTILENLGYILIGFVIIIAVFLILLSFIEKKLKIRFSQGKHSKNQTYVEKLSKIKIENPQTAMKEMDAVAKSFFREAFRIKGSPEYSTLTPYFAKRNNKLATDFSDQMTRFMFSGVQPTSQNVQSLVILLAEIISKNKILSGDEKKVLDKKSQEKNPQNKDSLIDKVPFFRKK